MSCLFNHQERDEMDKTMVCVPVEPTEAMIKAADATVNEYTLQVYEYEIVNIYAAMIAAALAQQANREAMT